MTENIITVGTKVALKGNESIVGTVTKVGNREYKGRVSIDVGLSSTIRRWTGELVVVRPVGDEWVGKTVRAPEGHRNRTVIAVFDDVLITRVENDDFALATAKFLNADTAVIVS